MVTKRFEKKSSQDKEIHCESCGKVHRCFDQIVLKDNLWKTISKETKCNVLCKECIEEHLGRKLTIDDLKFLDKEETIMIPVNFIWCALLNDGRPLRYFTWEEYDKYYNKYSKKFYNRKEWETIHGWYLEAFGKED